MTTFEIEAPAPETGERVRLEKGDFPQACGLCGAAPTVLCVRRMDADMEALQKLGEAPFVQDYYYCARHRGAAAALYDDFWDRV